MYTKHQKTYTYPLPLYILYHNVTVVIYANTPRCKINQVNPKNFCKKLKVVVHLAEMHKLAWATSRLLTVPMIEIQPTTEHPLPFDMSDEQPKTHKDGIAIAVNTTAALETLGPSIDFADKDLHSAAEVIKGTDKPNAPQAHTEFG